MTDFFAEKKASEKAFRDNLNKYLLKSPLLSTTNQFDIDTLTLLLGQCKIEGISAQGKINLQVLYAYLKTQDGGHLLNKSDFTTIFGSKKQIRVNQLLDILKKFDLNSFDFIEETQKYLFEEDKFSLKKFDDIMRKNKGNILNKTNKELLFKSFDFNDDKKINQDDLEIFVELMKSKEALKKK